MPTRFRFPSRVKKRQDEAKIRQEAYDKLSLDEKIAKHMHYISLNQPNEPIRDSHKNTVGSKQLKKLFKEKK